MTPALDELSIALRDVDNLILHHPKAVNPGPGRPATDEGPLLHSCVLLTYAAWEVYIENSLIWAVEEFTRKSSPSHLPQALRAFVANAAAVRSEPWRLAGDDWRKTAVEVVTTHVRGDVHTGSFGVNTAGPQQVVRLHREVLGARLLDECRWHPYSAEDIKRDLASLVEIRGSIAHTGKSLGPVHLWGARSWRDWVQRLANHLDGRLEEWVNSHLTEATANS